MTAITCAIFIVSYNRYSPETGCDRFYMDVASDFGGAWGSLSHGSPTFVTAKESGDLTQEDVIAGLRFVRSQIVLKLGETTVDSGYMRDRFYVNEKGVGKIELHVSCPIIRAIIDYLDNGDEADLMGAVDMLTDAGKFDHN